MSENTFSQLGRVEAIRQLFEGTPYRPFEEPVWFEAAKGDAAATATRVYTEGLDFNLVYFPLVHLGYKSVVGVTGELFAIMAKPQTLSVVMGVSGKLDFKQISEIWNGVVSAAKEYGYKSLSLDLQPSQNGLFISVAATGASSAEMAAKRPVAQSKDLICVSGSLGAAYLGMRILERERLKFDQGANDQSALEEYKMLVGSYLKPELGAGVLDALEDADICPSFGYFVTRGLSDALLRLNRDSKLGVKVYADKIPFEGNSFTLGKEINIDPVSAAMNGGDDFRLLFTIPIDKYEKFRKDFQAFDIIGHLALPEVGAVLVTPEGVELPLSSQSWK